MTQMIRGHNADPLYAHSGDHHLEFFSKAGSLMHKGKGRKAQKAAATSYYGKDTEATALSLFQPMWLSPGLESKALAMRLLFWLRDPRGGAGNRSGFRDCIRWLVQQGATTTDESGAAWLAVNLMRIPEWGRWDDVAELFGTPLETLASNVWVEAILRKDHLACKWAKVDMVPLQRALKINERGLRKLIVEPRKTIVERAMCSDDWTQINYSHVPSKAMNMYTKAFRTHDKARFDAYKEALKRGEKGVKINADVLFPHDCLKQHDTTIAEAQFKALPDFIGATDRRIIVLADRSGSMDDAVMPGITREDVCLSLALYCSDRLGKDNPFYRQFLEFQSTPFWVNWKTQSFVDARSMYTKSYAGSTNIQAALDSILSAAKTMKVSPSQMPNMLLIISDMQFDRSTQDSNVPRGMTMPYSGLACEGTGKTVVEKCMQAWEAAGYARPTIVFWCLAGYAGSPAKLETPNTALVSGFTPAILKSVLSGKQVDPREVMLRAIAKYQVDVPVTG